MLLCWDQRRNRPLAVAPVAIFYFPQHSLFCRLDAVSLKLDVAALGAALGACGDEDFRVCIGADDGSDVAAFNDGTLGICRETPLEGEQLGPDLGVGRNNRSRLSGAFEPETRVRERRRIEIARGFGRGGTRSADARP